MSAKYHHQVSRIFRTEEGANSGVAVADIVDGKVKMLPEHKKYGIQVGKFWKAFTLQPKTSTRSGVEFVRDLTPVELAKLDAGAQLSAILNIAEPDFRLGNGADIPPCPPEHPSTGTKTPEVVAWFKKYHPERWATMHLKWRNR